MIYNNNMEETSLAVGSGQVAQNARKSGWLGWSIALVSILVACLALGLAIQRAWASGDYSTLITHQTLTPFITAGFAIIGTLVASRHSRNPIGWIFEALGILFATTALAAALTTGESTTSGITQVAGWVNSWVWIPAALVPWTFVLLIFPDGRLPSSRWRFAAWAAALGLAMTILAVMFHPGLLPELGMVENPFGLPRLSPILEPLQYTGSALIAVGILGSLAAFYMRFRRSEGIQREQMKWLVYSVSINLLLGILSTAAWLFWPESPWIEELTIVVTNLGILGIAAAAAVAILRYRLYDINLIINRTLVYTALTTGVVALYGLVVGALGTLFQARSGWFVSLLATSVAAILVQPMRDRLQRLVNRLMYGERDDPYAILSGLSRQLEGSLSPEATLPAVVETVAHALKLPYVAIELKQEGSFTVAASYGPVGHELVQMPLIFQGETVGRLRLSTRSPNESFTPGEQRLLRDIARHIGVAAHTVLLSQHLRQMAEDLQRSREELVKSREEERRRLRRDLHDGLGPQLASLKLNLDVARNMVSRDPQTAETLLIDLRSQSQAAIADIRRLVLDLRPPALDELGLAGAIQEYTRQIAHQDGGLRLRFECPQDLPILPAAVEVAAYRISLEALANVVRHSQGKNGIISVSVADDFLQIEISDDGLGIPSDVRKGVGFYSMRERAAELGGTCVINTLPRGGTRVLARLPLG